MCIFSVSNYVTRHVEGSIVLSEKQTGSGLIQRALNCSEGSGAPFCVPRGSGVLTTAEASSPSTRLLLSSVLVEAGGQRTARGLQLSFSLSKDWN